MNDLHFGHFPGASSILEDVENTIRRALDEVGLCYFITSRVKSPKSTQAKLAQKGEKYRKSGLKMQDYFGARVVTYYSDDIKIAHRRVARVLSEHNQTIDPTDEHRFGPLRYNVVFYLPDAHRGFVQLPGLELVDSTIEVQFRTVFSEGWHEVEHDRRYKRQSDWEPFPELRRTFNGLAATLETCDTMLLKILHDLAYQHYRSRQWEGMISHKFRLRLPNDLLDSDIRSLLSSDPELAKRLYRVNRTKFLQDLAAQTFGPLPLTASNLVFLVNRLALHSDVLSKLEPPVVKPLLDQMTPSVSGRR